MLNYFKIPTFYFFDKLIILSNYNYIKLIFIIIILIYSYNEIKNRLFLYF